MGCLFQSIGIIFILVLLVPVMLLLSLFGRVRRTTFSHKQHMDDEPQTHNDDTVVEEMTPEERVNKPIDQSTVEYIDFEEVDDKK